MQNQTLELFAPAPVEAHTRSLAAGALLLGGFASASAQALLSALEGIVAKAPFRHLSTPGGLKMSVAMTNCGTSGWVSDRRGYRYEACDPQTGHAWPPMPRSWSSLASAAADCAGFRNFEPDACLINRYRPGARLTLHQDRDEQDLRAPVVSVSLGLPAVFLFGGFTRADKQQRVPLSHGDVVVWGGPARLRYHGVLPLEEGHHEVLGSQRINMTFRRAR